MALKKGYNKQQETREQQRKEERGGDRTRECAVSGRDLRVIGPQDRQKE